MRRYVGIVVVTILVGAGCWFFGLGIVPSIVAALVFAAAGVALRVIVRPFGEHEWPPPPPKRADGERHEVAQLGWAIQSPRGIVDERIIERVRRVASGALARRQLDLGNPKDRARIEGLVGAPTYLLLTSPNPPRVSVSALLGVLGRLESLEKTDRAARSQ